MFIDKLQQINSPQSLCGRKNVCVQTFRELEDGFVFLTGCRFRRQLLCQCSKTQHELFAAEIISRDISFLGQLRIPCGRAYTSNIDIFFHLVNTYSLGK